MHAGIYKYRYPVHYIESMASEDDKEVLDINSVASSFREHVKNSCLQKFSPLYFTGKIWDLFEK